MKTGFWNFKSAFSDNILLIDSENNTTYTYKDINYLVENLFHKINPERKKLAFLFCSNSVKSIVYYLALLRSGNAVLLLDSKLNEAIKSQLIEAYTPELIFSAGEFAYEGYSRIQINDDLSFLSRIEFSFKEIHPDIAVLLSTSGTTGSPKLVKLSYQNIQSNAESIAGYLPINSDERAITSLPMSYSYGLSVINSHLLKGAALVLTDKSVVFKDFWNVFVNHSCTSFAGVPYTYQMLKRTGFGKMKLPSLKYMTQAGGKLSEEFIKYFLEYAENNAKKFFVMYGQTEATARISFVPYKSLKEKIGSIGIAIPKGEIKLYDESTEVTQEGKTGEIVYSGPNVMLGYAENRNDLSKGDELKGILRTGDLAFKDRDGYFFVTGRIKRFIKIYGLRINLDEVEKMLQNHFHVSIACVGKDDLLRIAVQSNEKFLAGNVKQKCSEHYKINPTCISISLMESIPTNSSGKFDYSLIHEKLIARNSI